MAAGGGQDLWEKFGGGLRRPEAAGGGQGPLGEVRG